jgi:hypothetical protein
MPQWAQQASIMTDRNVPRVTFDTNVCNVINNPTKWPTLVDPDDAPGIRSAIAEGRIAGFVSEATLFIECLSFPDKLTPTSLLLGHRTRGLRPTLGWSPFSTISWQSGWSCSMLR